MGIRLVIVVLMQSCSLLTQKTKSLDHRAGCLISMSLKLKELLDSREKNGLLRTRAGVYFAG